ncbi:aldo/keto reductase [Halomonas denitrificans]|uniref:aldo/keto reductase n=1 Tax=Halomonas denitrificans TaxID=370769 RepID=UPI001C994D1C|nr:aldo/keto reductase [Halomonas denitrificans]MBY5967877.1 aldo/keto reductase [Halomonas denitrificans]
MTTSPIASRLPPKLRRAFEGLGVGAAQFGNMGKVTSAEDCLAAVDCAWELGLRFYDTAPHYGLGLSERRLGQALKGRSPDDVVISTKVGRLLEPNPAPRGSDEANGFLVADELIRRRDYTADGVRQSLEASLARLDMASVDVLWIHDPEEPTDRFEEALEGAVPELERLREQGKIAAWGVGSKDAGMLKRFVDQARPDLIMLAGRYTLLEQEQAGLMDACLERQVGVVAVGVFNSGLLARDEPPADAWYEYGPAPEAMLQRARDLAAVARAHGVSLPAAALAFPWRHPAVVNVMAGMRSPEQVKRNHGLSVRSIPEAFWSELRERDLLMAER